jgi:predicted glutamine amidotransferase
MFEPVCRMANSVNHKAETPCCGEFADSIVVVSEPLDDDHKKWIAVPENHVLIAMAGERARIQPILQVHQQEAAE